MNTFTVCVNNSVTMYNFIDVLDLAKDPLLFAQAFPLLVFVVHVKDLQVKQERSRVHSKHTRVSVTRKRVHWGQTRFRVNDDPKIGPVSADLTNNGVRLTQLWVMFRVKLTNFPVIVDPEWSLAPMDPFWVKFNPGFFF